MPRKGWYAKISNDVINHGCGWPGKWDNGVWRWWSSSQGVRVGCLCCSMHDLSLNLEKGDTSPYPRTHTHTHTPMLSLCSSDTEDRVECSICDSLMEHNTMNVLTYIHKLACVLCTCNTYEGIHIIWTKSVLVLNWQVWSLLNIRSTGINNCFEHQISQLISCHVLSWVLAWQSGEQWRIKAIWTHTTRLRDKLINSLIFYSD